MNAPATREPGVFEKPQTLMGFSLCSTMWEENTPEILKSGQTHAEAGSVAVVFSSVGRAGVLSAASAVLFVISVISVVFMAKNPFKKT